ncbi:hypothetical protein ABW636_07460 [Aquimarina sp. 2201CG1-2-11]|uniref:hypothetical protein n=1 Tax=Aquimarina discodermiae TaxID=3231043 RepID=UPI003462D90E
MKSIKLLLFFFIVTSCSIKKNIKRTSPKDITIDLKVDSIEYRSGRWVKLFVEIKNNSSADITILKPSSEYGDQMNYFYVKYDCNLMSETEVYYPVPVVKKTDSDLITIQAKSSSIVELKGNLYDVICDSSEITKVKVTYDSRSEELPEWLIKKIGTDQSKLKDRLTKLKIESKEITIGY